MAEAQNIVSRLGERSKRALLLFEPGIGYGPCAPPGASAFKANLHSWGLLVRQGIFHELTPLGLEAQITIRTADSAPERLLRALQELEPKDRA